MEVDPYRHASSLVQIGGGRKANVALLSFAIRGTTGVDLRWHPRKEFLAFTDDQKNELRGWQGTKAGKAVIKK